MTDDELSALVAGNAQTAERLNQKTESLDRQLGSLAQSTERLTQKTESLDRQLSLLTQKTESLDRQLSLLTQQVQTMANSQAGSDTRLITAERNIQGIYDILQAYAREQDARSQLIDQQIQALVDERRRS